MNVDAPEVRYAYRRQVKRAADRGIDWLFTLETWAAVWQESGRWAERGRHGHKYVMARNGDAGPYSPSNVQIKTHSENARERMENYPVPKRKSSGFGYGKGWTLHPTKAKPYQAKFRGQSLGYYVTADEASAVYQAAVSAAKEGLAARVRRKTGRAPAKVYELRRQPK